MAKFLSKINSPDYIENRILKIDSDENLIPSALTVSEYDNNQISISLADGNVSQRILITDDATSNTNVYNFQQKNNPSQEYQDLMVIKDNGHVVANVFEGNLNGNADTSTQIHVTETSPASTTNYRLVFTSASATGNAHMRINNGDAQLTILEGTTSTTGAEILSIGNGIASGTAGNKRGTFRLYSQSTGYDDITASNHTGQFIHTLPNSSGTLLNSVNYTNYTVTKAGTGASGNWGINITGSAAKLTTPRPFSITGDTVASAVNFDGSANVQLSTMRRGCSVGQSSSTSTNPWYKFADITVDSSYVDKHIIFFVYSSYSDSSNMMGILKAHVRTSSTGTFDVGELKWLVRGSSITNADFVLAYNNTSPAKVELWCKCAIGYRGYHFDVIAEGDRGNRSTRIWNLYNTWTAGSAAEPTAGFTQVTSTAITIVNDTSGNAGSATKLQTARKINGVDFDGTKDITIDAGGSGGHTILNSSGTAMTQRSKLRFNNATVTDDANNDVTIITPSGTSGNYLPLTGGTLSGNLYFNHTSSSKSGEIGWTAGTVRQKLLINDGAAEIFVFQQSKDSGQTWLDLMTIKNDSEVEATTFTGALNGNAKTATTLQTARTINGTSFNGSANITTANWGTARNIGIVNSDGTGTAVTTSVNGSANVNLKLPATIKATLTGNASTATTLANARTINGTSFNGSANITTANWGTARTITIGNTGKSVNGSANITWSLSEIGAAASSHTHSYLPLSGGTMTGTISSSKTTGTYLAGSQGTAVINSTASGGSYTTLLKANSSNGKFTLSVYQTYMLLGYMSNKTIEAGNNNLDKSLRFLEDGTLIPGASNVQNLGSSTNKWLNVYATTFTGNLSGNATTATTATKANQLTTARTIAISGGVTGTATSFNGTANITIPVTAVDASKLTNKNTIKASEINNNKHWVPSNDNSVTNFVSMTVDEYEESADSLPTGTVVAITDSNESYVTTQPSSITCDLPLDL